jgi:DNA-binding PadR family transcriptional regulator
MAASDNRKLTKNSFVVLGLVDLLGEVSAYDLKQAIAKSVDNFWPLPYITYYREPARLAKAGLLTERQQEGGRRKRLYEINDRGRATLAEWLASPELSDPELRDEAMVKLFFGAEPRPIFERRAAWHRAKLTELGEYLDSLDEDSEWPDGVRASLIAGVTYHRLLTGAYEDVLEQLSAGEADATAPRT